MLHTGGVQLTVAVLVPTRVSPQGYGSSATLPSWLAASDGGANAGARGSSGKSTLRETTRANVPAQASKAGAAESSQARSRTRALCR